MKEQYLFKIINRFSFLLVIFNYILFAGDYILPTTLSFLWICIWTYISLSLKLRKDKYRKLFFPALLPILATLFFTNTRNDLAVIGILCLYAFYFLLRDPKKIFFESSKLEFRNGLIAIALIIPISFVSRDIPRFEAVSIPFLFLYLISGIMLSRATRSALHNKSTGKLNFTYALAVCSLMFLLSIEKVRDYIMSFIMLCIRYFLLLVGYLARLTLLIIPAPAREKIAPLKGPKDPGVFISGKNHKSEFNLENSPVYLVLKIAFAVFILLVIILVIKKLFGSYKRSRISQEEFIESHEFITEDSRIPLRKTVFNKVKNIFTPKTYKEIIRLNYSKYIQSCIKNNIPITHSDTTFEISHKSQELYSRNIIEKMRGVYINVRYTNAEATKDTLKNFMDSYNSLKKHKNS